MYVGDAVRHVELRGGSLSGQVCEVAIGPRGLVLIRAHAPMRIQYPKALLSVIKRRKRKIIPFGNLYNFKHVAIHVIKTTIFPWFPPFSTCKMVARKGSAKLSM